MLRPSDLQQMYRGPFCQISSKPTSLPQGGLRDPPAYSPPPSPRPAHAVLASPVPPEEADPNASPPAYSSVDPETDARHKKQTKAYPPSTPSGPSDAPAEDVLHFVDPAHDTIASLSLRYGVPARELRRTNALYADHLLPARRTILIPGAFYKGGVSLSPRPPEGEEEEARKGNIRKWMVACKVAEYDIALLYLQQTSPPYDLDAAIAAYKADEKWEKDHPLASTTTQKGKMDPSSKAKPKRRSLWGSSGGLTGQL
ncbi:MAG: hypothetical protein M1819_001098 [Sarea resinae]|nr:MAG: hypothetical protein M1819_001098 [Sarea resinae]